MKKKGQRKRVREVKMEEWEGGKEKDKVFPVLRHESQSSERFSHEWGVNQIPEPRTHMFE